MATGGVFQIITNNGIQDKLILATEKLLENIKKISYEELKKLQQKYPKCPEEKLMSMQQAWMPTLHSIEKTHIMFFNASYKPFVAIGHEYSKTNPRDGMIQLGSSFTFQLPIIGEFINDPVLHMKLTGLSAVNTVDKVRYVEFLANRLLKKATMKIQKMEFDTYTSETQNAYYQFKVPPNKEIGYLRNIGQEIPKTGYLTPSPTVDQIREYRYFGDGNQTFKNSHNEVELWIPLLFWFKDLHTSLPNFILPRNQVEIEIQLESQELLIAYSNNGGGGQYIKPTVSICELYLNHIFILPEILKIFINRFGFQLIRVHKEHREILTSANDQVKLHQLKFPVESMYIAFRPKANLTNSQRWHRNTHITQTTVKEAVVVPGDILQVGSAVYLDEQPVISKLELRAYDIVIYPEIEPSFYNQYIPYRYGLLTKTPRDIGWYMMNFNFNPGEYQPSGHFNTSQARELYLRYQSAYDANTNLPIISNTNPVELIVIADCINFLLYKDNNAVLRFMA